MISKGDIIAAAERIRPHVHITPVVTSRGLDEMLSASLFFKCENLQKVGAFKIRGATNAVLSLSHEEAARGVATHSSGNHAQAVALAARGRGIAAHIVMPRNAKKVKIDAVRGYGGQITLCEPTLKARQETLENLVRRTGAVVIHPYNDWRIIAGQATCAKELIEQVNDLDMIIAPVGGGGLLSGTALSAKYFGDRIRVLGAEPRNADDACRSLISGVRQESIDPKTVADGLLTSLGDLTFGVIERHVEAILTVTEENIVAGMRQLWERLKQVVEPSGAVPFAALLEHREEIAGRRIGVILSGGNVDLENLPWQMPRQPM